MKKLCIICILCMLVLSGCTPKSQLMSSAIDILERVENTCREISDNVEKLNDEYTSGIFSDIKLNIDKCRKSLENSPSRDDIESTTIVLSRLEKELGSIKTLSGGMDDYIPEFTFDFVNETGKIASELVMLSEAGEEIKHSDDISDGERVEISYPIESGVWSVTTYMSNGDEVACEGLDLSVIKTLKLGKTNGEYEYFAE